MIQPCRKSSSDSAPSPYRVESTDNSKVYRIIRVPQAPSKKEGGSNQEEENNGKEEG